MHTFSSVLKSRAYLVVIKIVGKYPFTQTNEHHKKSVFLYETEMSDLHILPGQFLQECNQDSLRYSAQNTVVVSHVFVFPSVLILIIPVQYFQILSETFS